MAGITCPGCGKHWVSDNYESPHHVNPDDEDNDWICYATPVDGIKGADYSLSREKQEAARIHRFAQKIETTDE